MLQSRELSQLPAGLPFELVDDGFEPSMVPLVPREPLVPVLLRGPPSMVSPMGPTSSEPQAVNDAIPKKPRTTERLAARDMRRR